MDLASLPADFLMPLFRRLEEAKCQEFEKQVDALSKKFVPSPEYKDPRRVQRVLKSPLLEAAAT
eukprot:11659772-Prorocentrum_lima.AAC.1